MKAADALRILARGNRPTDALLPPCRLEGLGTKAYGEEAVINHFRQMPIDGLEAAEQVVSRGHVALFAGDASLIADVHNERILRIWRLGSGEPGFAEPAIGVPFDTDLFQLRRDVALRSEDHPELDPDAFDPLQKIGYDLAHGWTHIDHLPSWRTRPFLLRAFSEGKTGAGLFAVHRLGPARKRSAGFFFVAAKFAFGSAKPAAPKIVRDVAGEKAVEKAIWRTSFA